MCEFNRSRSFFDLITQDTYNMTISNISSETLGPIETKFNLRPSGAEGTKMCSNGPVQFTCPHELNDHL